MMMSMSPKSLSVFFCLLLAGADSFIVRSNDAGTSRRLELQSHETVDSEPRREAFTTLATALTGGLLASIVSPVEPAFASGGATAGKYTYVLRGCIKATFFGNRKGMYRSHAYGFLSCQTTGLFLSQNVGTTVASSRVSTTSFLWAQACWRETPQMKRSNFSLT